MNILLTFLLSLACSSLFSCLICVLENFLKLLKIVPFGKLSFMIYCNTFKRLAFQQLRGDLWPMVSNSVSMSFLQQGLAFPFRNVTMKKWIKAISATICN